MRIIRNYDVASYYPHLITINGYASRNMADPEMFAKTLETRMKAKKAGDKTTADALKLIVNTAYGATKNGIRDTGYNDLYDPLMARSVCISGQLYLLELANHLIDDIPDLKVVQLNTDGIMVEFDDSQYQKVLAITKEWQERTGFELEEDKIKAIYQKDVNNYIEIASDGSLKAKGGYLVRGVSKAGAFKVNNEANIIATATIKYFVDGIDPAETVLGCDDIKQFQFIAKGSSKYSRVYQLIDGVETPAQKVNRVYATKDQKYGTLYKVKAENGQVSKIAGLPEHCIIDNDNHLTIDDVDKAWYVVLAQKHIDDFKGISNIKQGRKSKMATAKAQNIYQKLAAAREEFMASDIEKSGKNFHLKTQYWELKDIVPTAMSVMHKNSLIPIYSFNNEFAQLIVVNMENPDERVVFQLPMRELTGNAAINAVQALGAVQTYMRRYLYLQALDICEADEIEPHLSKPDTAEKIEEKRTGDPVQPVKTAEPPKVAPAASRDQIKQNLTAVDGKPDEIQMEQLKAKLGELAKSGKPEFVDLFKAIMTRTNNLQTITRKSAETVLRQITSVLEGDKPNA